MHNTHWYFKHEILNCYISTRKNAMWTQLFKLKQNKMGGSNAILDNVSVWKLFCKPLIKKF
jgi:hypothetical protein